MRKSDFIAFIIQGLERKGWELNSDFYAPMIEEVVKLCEDYGMQPPAKISEQEDFLGNTISRFEYAWDEGFDKSPEPVVFRVGCVYRHVNNHASLDMKVLSVLHKNNKRTKLKVQYITRDTQRTQYTAKGMSRCVDYVTIVAEDYKNWSVK